MAHGKVFIIDDEDDNLAYLSEIITGAGYEAEAFSDGSEALIKMQAETPEMVFLDVQMPRMNGFQVLKAIRESDILAKVPVVLLSAISAVTGDEYDPDRIQAQYGVRPDAFISKPIRPEGVREQLARFVKPKPS
ncbi:MAG: response regulator [Planctomycetota bacterium]|jgi:two-component system chemotaxis sensor kinase CheA